MISGGFAIIFRLLLLGLVVALLGACAPVASQPSKQQADVHYTLGISHLQANSPTLALKEFLRAAEIDPENSDIQVALAQAYQLKKSYQNAERHYLRALQLAEGDPRYQNNLASLYLDMGQWDKAIDYFDKASANLLFLNSHVALTGKGYAYYRKGDYSSALASYQEALAIAPLYAPAHFYKSEVYRALEQPDLYRKSLERAIELAPQYVQARYELGILLLKEQQKERALKEFRTVVECREAGDYLIEQLHSLRER